MNNIAKIDNQFRNPKIDLEIIKAMYPNLKDADKPKMKEKALKAFNIVLRNYYDNDIKLSLPQVWSIVKYGDEYNIQQTLLYHTIVASRTGLWAGYDVEYGPMVERSYHKPKSSYQYDGRTINTPEKNITLTVPLWVKTTAHRIVPGQTKPGGFPVILFWDTTYGTDAPGSTFPSDFYCRMPDYMLFKTSLSRSLGITYPEVCIGYTYEELQGKTIFDDSMVINQITEKKVNQETGEILNVENKITTPVANSIENNKDTCNILPDEDTFYTLNDKTYTKITFAAEYIQKLDNVFCEQDKEEYDIWSNNNLAEITRWRKNNKSTQEYLDIMLAANNMKTRITEDKKVKEQIAIQSIARETNLINEEHNRET